MPLDLILYDENDDPWHPEPTESQRLLDQVVSQGIRAVEEIADGCPVYVHHIGDLTHGTRYPRELVSTRQSDHLEIAVANMARWFELPNVVYMGLYKGTGVHEFGEGSASIVVSKWLQEMFEDKQIVCVSHALVTKDGILFDMAHHGPGTGIRNWLKGNVLRLYTRSLMMDLLDGGLDVPDVLVRAHFHNYVSETVTVRRMNKTHRTRAFILPSLSFITNYARKAAKSPSAVTIGMIAIETIDNKIVKVYDSSPFIETFDLRKEINLD